MKQVIAIIRINKINETKEALTAAGVSSFTVRKVLGRGKGQVDFRVLHGAKEGSDEAIARLQDDGPMLTPKRLLMIVVPDSKVKPVVEAIIRVNKKGNPGDGRIFILPVPEAVRIRTGERDHAALKED